MKLEKEDSILSEFLRSIGPWKRHIIIGGGFAPIVYKLYLADYKKGNPPVGTYDLDSLVSRRVPKVSNKNISEYLKEAGFVPIFKTLSIPASEAHVKVINGIELEVEFLTTSNVRKDKDRNVFISGIVAQPLRYLELSLQKIIEFKTHSDQMGIVVSPEAWIFHKGLTFLKRSDKSKLYKDLYGIWYVSTQLGNFSEEAIIRLKTLEKQFPKWFKTFQKNLVTWSQNSSPQDWMNLEIQDPFGNLKKLNFEYFLKQLT